MTVRLPSSIAALLNCGSRWPWLTAVCIILCLDLNLSVILDKDVLYFHVKTYLRPSTDYLSDTLLAYSGGLLSVVGKTNILIYLESASIVIVYMIACFVLMLCALTVSQLYFQLPFKGMVDNSTVIGFWSTILYNYEYLYLFVVNLFFKSMLCVKMTKQVSLANFQAGYLEIKTQSRVSDGIFELDTLNSNICSNIECKSIDHIFLIILTAAAYICSFLMMIISNKITSHRPDPKISSKYAAWDLVHPACITLIMLSKYCVLSINSQIDPNHIFYTVTIVILAVDLVIHLATRVYYNRNMNTVRTFEILVLLTVTIIAMDHTWFKFIKTNNHSQMKLSLVILLLWTLIMRLYTLAFNRRYIDLNRSKVKGLHTRRSFFQMVYYLFRFLVRSDQGRCSEKDKLTMMKLLLEYYELLKHSESHQDGIMDHILSIIKRHVENQAMFQKIVTAEDGDTVTIDIGAVGVGKLAKDLVYLLDIMFESEVRQYTHHQAKLPSHLINSYIYFLFSYKGQAAKACWIMRKLFIGRRFDKNMANNLDASVLRESLSRKIATNVEATELKLMATERDDSEIKVQIDHRTAILFYNTLFDIKKAIGKLMAIRGEVLTNLNENTLTTKDLFEQTQKNIQLRLDCESLLSKAAGIAGNGSTPLAILHCFYARFVEFDARLANSKLRSFASKPFELSTPKSSDQAARVDILASSAIIIMGAETDSFHRIELASSNIQDYIGFQVKDLIGNDLSILIPSPYREIHRKLSDPSFGTGSLIRQAKQMATYILTKDQFIRNVIITLRINSSFERGLEIVAMLQFDQVDKSCRSAIVCFDKNKVLELTKSCSQLMAKNTHFCGDDLKRVGQAFCRVATYLKNHKVASIQDLNMDHKDLQAYAKLSTGMPICFTGAFSDDTYIATISALPEKLVNNNAALIMLHTEDMFDPQKLNKPPKVQKKQENQVMGTVLGFVSKIANDNEADAGFGTTNRMVTIQESPEDSVFSKNPKTNLMKSGSRNMTNINRLITTTTSRYVFMAYGNTVAMTQGDSMDRSDDSSVMIENKNGNEKAHVKPKKSMTLGSVVSVRGKIDYEAHELAKYVYRVSKPKTFTIGCLILLILFFAPMAFQVAVGLNKFDVKFEVLKEIKFKSKALDLTSWSVWALVLVNIKIDGSRMVQNGIIPNDFYAEYNYTDIVGTCTKERFQVAQQLILYLRRVDNFMMNTTFNFEYSQFPRYSSIKTYSYDDRSGQIVWSQNTKNIFEAVAYIQPIVDDFTIKRNDTTWAGGPIGIDRDKDPEAELIRRNLQDDLQAYVLEAVEMTKAYFLMITRHSIDTIYWSQYINAITTASVIFLIGLVMILYTSFTNRSLRKTLMFKV